KQKKQTTGPAGSETVAVLPVLFFCLRFRVFRVFRGFVSGRTSQLFGLLPRLEWQEALASATSPLLNGGIHVRKTSLFLVLPLGAARHCRRRGSPADRVAVPSLDARSPGGDLRSRGGRGVSDHRETAPHRAAVRR